MNYKLKLTSVSILCGMFVQVYGMTDAARMALSRNDKDYAYFTNALPESGFLRQAILSKFNKHIVVPCYIKKYGDLSSYDDASPYYQALGKEAQDKLKIPKSEQLPIKKMRVSGMTSNESSAESATVPRLVTDARCTPNAIIVNENIMNQRTLSQRRIILFHEAVHRKNYDVADSKFREWIIIPTVVLSNLVVTQCIGGGLAYSALYAYCFFKNRPTTFIKIDPIRTYKDVLLIITGIAGGLCVGIKSIKPMDKKLNQFLLDKSCYSQQEHRADNRAFDVSSCHKCILEYAQIRTPKETETGRVLIDEGYFCHEEIIAKAEEYKDKLCSDHAKEINGKEMSLE